MAKIPLEIVALEGDSYHLLVDVVINKSILGKLVVDTGASKTVLDSSLALESFEMKEQEESYTGGIGGEVDAAFVQVKNFEIGELKLKKMVIPSFSFDTLNAIYEKAVNQRIIGLLGSDLLLKFDAKIDYKNKILKLRTRK